MDTGPRFEPILARHSIERCAFSVNFDQPVPAKALGRIIDNATLSVAHLGLSRSAAPGTAITIDLATGAVMPTTEQNQHAHFASGEGNALTITPISVSWQTTQYIRWAPFKGQCEDIVAPLLDQFAEMVSIAAIKLEYWDRFIWNGEDPQVVDFYPLINPSSGFVVPAAVRNNTYWHSHCGWFEEGDQSLRRLVNLNVDAAPHALDPTKTVPSLSVFTMAQEQYIVGVESKEITSAGAMAASQNLHNALKALFGETISTEMASRVDLWGNSN